MIPLPSYKGKIVGVLGLGKSGMATVLALREAGAKVLVWDVGSPGTELEFAL